MSNLDYDRSLAIVILHKTDMHLLQELFMPKEIAQKQNIKSRFLVQRSRLRVPHSFRLKHYHLSFSKYILTRGSDHQS